VKKIFFSSRAENSLTNSTTSTNKSERNRLNHKKFLEYFYKISLIGHVRKECRLKVKILFLTFMTSQFLIKKLLRKLRTEVASKKNIKLIR
jgi:hypothetical protein